MADTVRLNVILTREESEALKLYCESKRRSQSDVLREFIRSLANVSDCQENPHC